MKGTTTATRTKAVRLHRLEKEFLRAFNVCKTPCMRAALKELAGETFDVVIVGAGIHGACAAWSASRMGLKTALIDAGDFGGAASANSLKVIHGGLRYLQHGNLKRMRESIRARRRFLVLAPKLVKPQPFAIPTYGSGVRGRAALRVALALNDLISADRNAGLDDGHRLPAGRLLSRSEAAQLWPGLPADAYDGAAVWCDALAHNTERLTLAFVLGARARGAVALNYVRATKVLEGGGAVSGVEARDELDGAAFPIRARVVLNAAGPWWQHWAPMGVRPGPLVGAWNMVVRANWFGPYGVGLESTQEHRDAEALVQRGKRNLFFVPWRGGTMIGTVYEPFAGDPAEYRPSSSSVESFIREINAVLPSAKLTMEQVTLLHVGVQPGSPGGVSPEPDKHSEIVAGPLRGMFSIKGVKYTTGLTVGEQAACAIARELGRPGVPPGDEPLPGAVPEPENLGELVRRAVQDECAVRLADVLQRRSGLGTFEPPSRALREEVSVKMSALLDWSEVRRAAELRHVEEAYRALRVPPVP